jgi:lipoate-protein ligase A
MNERLHGEYKVPGGKLVAVDLSVADGRLAEVQVSGDFFLDPDEALPLIDRALGGLSTETAVGELSRPTSPGPARRASSASR